jgi:hypothetical protein
MTYKIMEDTYVCDYCGAPADPSELDETGEILGESGIGKDGEYHELCQKCMAKFKVETCVDCCRWESLDKLDDFYCPECVEKRDRR